MSQAVPDNSATFEHHGIRGAEGPEILRQIAPLNEQYSVWGRTVKGGRHPDGHKLTSEERLRIELQTDILNSLMGNEAVHINEVTEKLVEAYRRTFGEWFDLVANERPEIGREILTRQFAEAWINVEDLLQNTPR